MTKIDDLVNWARRVRQYMFKTLGQLNYKNVRLHWWSAAVKYALCFGVFECINNIAIPGFHNYFSRISHKIETNCA